MVIKVQILIFVKITMSKMNKNCSQNKSPKLKLETKIKLYELFGRIVVQSDSRELIYTTFCTQKDPLSKKRIRQTQSWTQDIN